MKSFATNVPTKAMRPPEHPCRRLMYYIINSSAFDGFITLVATQRIIPTD